jgi:hypothetical protein
MPIKFKCPNCQKSLSVKEHLAGKRAPCPACKKALTIPAPTATAADLEDLAASALADEPPPPQQPAEQPTAIDFICPYCDEPLHLSLDLAGKQEPCPKCKRIIKVPMPVKQEPQDWRNKELRGPLLARQEAEQPPIGAWGTATKPGTVSQEALEEADAIPIEREPLTTGQKIRRWALVFGGVAALFLGWIFLRSYWSKSLQDKAVAQAKVYVEDAKSKGKLSPEGAAELYVALGELDLRANKGLDALNNFKKARAQLLPTSADPSERDAVLRDLALAQVNLAGNPQQVEDKVRINWEDAATQWLQTMQRVGAFDARVATARTVCRELIAKEQWPLAAGVIRWLMDAVQTPAQGKNKKDSPQTVFAQPVALLLALHRPKLAKIVLPIPKKGKSTHLATELIQTANWSNLATAREFFVKADGPVPQRLECLLTVAVAALDQGHDDEARTCVDAAIGLLRTLPKEEPPSAWLLLQWAELASGTDQAVPQQAFTEAMTNDLALRGRAQLEQYRRQIKNTEDAAEDSWSKAVPDTNLLAHALALQVLARHRAKQGAGSELLTTIANLEPENVRPLGYIGVALGVQDRTK